MVTAFQAPVYNPATVTVSALLQARPANLGGRVVLRSPKRDLSFIRLNKTVLQSRIFWCKHFTTIRRDLSKQFG